jgi:transcription elongation factor Elf1
VSEITNCPECGHNKDMSLVEGLADTYDGVLYRVCCSSCGRDWTWEMKLTPLPEFEITDNDEYGYLNSNRV